MNLRIDDDLLEPDVFLKRAIEAKLEWLNKRIEELLVTGRHQEEIERLSVARAEFMEILRSPRLYLSKPAGETAVQPSSHPPPASASPFEPVAPPAPAARASFLPKGAIPEPRRFSATAGRAGTAAPTPAPTARTPGKPAAPAAAASAPKVGGGMMSFLKSVQRTSTTPPPPVATPPSPASSPADSAQGSMLNFLENIKQSAAPRPADAPNVVALLKNRAAGDGFKDIYEMLDFKRDLLVKSLAATAATPATAKTRAAIEQEIREIDDLMKLKQNEIVGQIREFKEIAAVDKGGLAAIQSEISGLLDEIK